MIRTIPLVVIHKSVEVVVVRVGSSISVVNVWLGKWIDWAVIDHMPWGVTSSTDLKVANVVGMSPSVTEITLGLQTMMCHMTGRCLSTSGTDVHWAEEPMMTEIRANVILGVGGGGVRALDKDSGRRRGDPLAFSDLDPDDIVGVYWASGRRGGRG